MDTVMNWLAFAALVYVIGVKARWWDGPITRFRRRRQSARHSPVPAAQGPEQSPPTVTVRGATPDAHATRTGSRSDIEGDNPQDIDRDMRHDIPSPGLWARLRQAADLVIHPDVVDDDAETDDGVATEPPPSSPTVTATEVPPPRVVVQYVPLGSWTGNVAALDADGNQVIVQYRTRSALAAPLPDLSGPDDEDVGDEDAEVASIDEVALRQDWLRAIDADGRFTASEIAQMYREKWGRGRRTLERDRAAMTGPPGHRFRTR